MYEDDFLEEAYEDKNGGEYEGPEEDFEDFDDCPCGCGDCGTCSPNCGENGQRCPEGHCLGQDAEMWREADRTYYSDLAAQYC